MSAFLDTNVLVYAQQTGEKADRARARALLAEGGLLSVQVLTIIDPFRPRASRLTPLLRLREKGARPSLIGRFLAPDGSSLQR